MDSSANDPYALTKEKGGRVRKQHDALAAASVILLVLVSAFPAVAAENNKPCLCRASIIPSEGTARTVYVAMVDYEDPDGDAPARVEVYVSGQAYPMRLVSGRAAKGTYRARLTLPPGEHNYYFYAEDVRGMSERWPRYGAKPGPFVGQRERYNRLPVLTDGGVYFEDGDDYAVYTFTVHYKDRDDIEQPRRICVAVDGIWHDMRLHKGKPYDGIYLYQARLPAGPHAYYFGAIDERGDCMMHPKHGFLRGPEVTGRPNIAPVLLDPKVTPAGGSSSTTFSFLVNYRDIDLDPAALAVVYVDGIPRPMKRVAGKSYDGLYSCRVRTFEGRRHDYYFYFEDGRGGTCRIPERGVFHGPVVTNFNLGWTDF